MHGFASDHRSMRNSYIHPLPHTNCLHVQVLSHLEHVATWARLRARDLATGAEVPSSLSYYIIPEVTLIHNQESVGL